MLPEPPAMPFEFDHQIIIEVFTYKGTQHYRYSDGTWRQMVGNTLQLQYIPSFVAELEALYQVWKQNLSIDELTLY